MNNYCYIALHKAHCWSGNEEMVNACISEFKSINPADAHVMDNHASAIQAAKDNGFSAEVIQKAEEITA